MGLSSDLISQFVKVTNDIETDKPSNTVYGTVVKHEGEKYVRIDGSERLTRAGKVTDAEVNDRVVVTIENHTATITGNISSPSARTDRVEELGGEIQKVAILVAGKVSTDELIAEIARIDSLVAKDVVIEKRLDAAEAVIVTLDATYATIDKLESEYATIEKLESEYTTTTNLEAKYATISKLESDYATIAKLESDYIKTTEIDAKYATIDKLENEYASIAHLTANYAKIVELQAVEGTIGSLNSDVADIKTLTSNFISGNTVHTNFANAVIAQLGDAQIKSSMIEDLTTHSIAASQITSGDIITDKVNVKSQDGHLVISDQTMQISDTTRVRVQIGKDASGDYSINIWDANGNLMFSKGGITEDAVKDKIIRDDMVRDNANISASKLNIDSLFDVINEDGSHTLKSSKVKLDEEGQTLDVAFKSMTTKVFGRNLIAGTSSDTVYSGVVALDSTLDYKDVWSAKTIGEVNGTEYVVSFDAKADEEIDIRCFFYSPNTTLTSESSTGGHRNNVEDGTSYVHVTTEWKRYWVKWTQTSTNTKKTVIVGRNSSLTNRVYIRAVKLEAGDKATAWTPAPEDVGSNTVKTTELSTNYHNLTIDIASLRSTIVDQSQLIDSKADGSRVSTLESNYSDLTQEIDEISGTVSANTTIIDEETGETISLSSAFSQFKLDLEGFETTVNGMTIGGRNLLLNTGSNEGDITLNGSSINKSGISSYNNSNGVQTFNCSGSNVEIFYRFMAPNATNMYGLEAGQTYIFSGKAKIETISGAFGKLAVRGQYHAGSGWTGGVVETIATADSSDWVDFSVKFMINDVAKGFYLSLQVYYPGDENNKGSWSGTVQTKELKLEKGNIATAWTPAPEDVDSAIVKSAETVTKQTKDLLGQYAKSSDLDDYCTNSAFEQTANSIVSRVEGLSLSGKNIIANVSQKETVLGGYPTSGHSEGVSGKTSIIPTDNEYVLSFEAKSTVDGDRIRCHFYSPNTTLTVETSTSPGVIGNATDGMATLPVTTSWKRYWVKYTQNGAETTSKKSWIVGRRMAGLGSGSISVRAIKLESGTQATGWDSSSEIQQLADSINLSVTSILGQTATIKLTANGQTEAKEIDFNVREAFANDPTLITVEAGTVTFNAGTLLINAGNFTLDGTGNIVAKSGTIGSITLWELGLYCRKDNVYSGMASITANVDQTGIYNCFYAGSNNPLGVDAKFRVTHDGELYASDAEISGVITTTDDKLEAKLTGGGLRLSYDGTICGYVTSQLIEDVYQTTSMILRVPYRGVIEFVSESQAGGAVSHYKLHDRPDEESFNREDYKTYTHFFLSTVYILGEVYFNSRTTHNNWMYIKNRNGIGWYTSDGSQDQMISMGTDDIFIVGSKYHNAIFSGDVLQLVADGQLQLKSSANSIVYTGASTTSGTSYFNHNTNGTCVLGASDKRWKQLYASSACNTSSDIRLKKNIVGLSDEHSELFDRLQPVQYNMINGDNRIHYGFVAQQVASAMAELSIDEDELDIVHHDYWIDRETSEPCDEYGIVYDNFIAMLVHEVQKLKREIKTLKGE